MALNTPSVIRNSFSRFFARPDVDGSELLGIVIDSLVAGILIGITAAVLLFAASN